MVSEAYGQSRGPMALTVLITTVVQVLWDLCTNRVFKGKNLAGRMGGDRVTIQNEVVQVVQKRTLSYQR